MTSLLNQIHSPEDLKDLTTEDLNRLSKEIRKYLVDVLSVTGGHLSSNLGVVELTIALHYVFDSPYDKMIWDVGHQSYVHKILTGRKEQLNTIRQYKGISGFPKRSESDHDCFDAGHSSTSISAALGYAVARDIQKEGNAVIAIIGDGSLTAGMAYEALNNGAQMKSNFIVILNDNQMSIAKNVGGMAQYLDGIRTGKVYRVIKDDVHKVFDHVPIVGKGLTKVAKVIKEGIKQVFIPGMFFEEMGYTYLGPIDGHSIPQVIRVLNQARKIDGPVLIHVNTVKGKGYHHAELDPSKYHGVKPTVNKNGKLIIVEPGEHKKSYGDLLGDRLIQYVQAKEEVVGITAAMPDGTGLSKFAEQCPKAFFDVGIAEQHAVTFAAGLGLKGIKPFVAIYSTFLQRGYDQVLHDVCVQNVPVVFVIDRAGIVGEDGETHQGSYDISYLNHMPNMTIMAPSDDMTFNAMLDYSLRYKEGPLAIRYPKGDAPHLSDDEVIIEYGRSRVLKEGGDIAVIAVGSMVQTVLDASEMMTLPLTVIDAMFMKPIDHQLMDAIATKYKQLYIVEENAVIGGYGSEVLRYMNSKKYNIEIELIGLEDTFIEHGPRKQLLDDMGLSSSKIATLIESKNR
jgi:1-deoxy-D-xylulose-5-phosphate synthase